MEEYKDEVTCMHDIIVNIYDIEEKINFRGLGDQPLINTIEYLEENNITGVTIDVGLFYWNQCNWAIPLDLMKRLVKLDITVWVSAYKTIPEKPAEPCFT